MPFLKVLEKTNKQQANKQTSKQTNKQTKLKPFLQPILRNWSLSIYPEKIRKPEVL